MNRSDVGIVFVHGAWHNAGAWMHVIPQLEAVGYTARALDLPGAGGHARMPESYFKRPLDPVAFATEPSPNAGVEQAERTSAVVRVIEAMERPVFLVGHSLGGVTISAVAETIPDRLAGVVFLTAFMLPPGMTAVAMIQHATMADALVPSLLLADPEATGALRIDPRSDDPAYRARLKSAFYADVDDVALAPVVAALHCDEPASVTVRPSPITSDRFGRVPRYYIRCVEDRAIPLSGQDFMIASVDDAIGGVTEVRTLNASHSPFLSRPSDLVEILAAMTR